jgi:trigger factor
LATNVIPAKAGIQYNRTKEFNMSEIKTKLEDVNSIKKKIEVSIPVERVKKVLEEEYKKIGKEAKVKGFRKGKVPSHMLEKMYSAEAAKEVMESLVRESYPKAIEKEMAVPISAPYVEPGEFDKEKPFTYSATFEIRPTVEVKEYKGLKLEKVEITVTKEEVEQQLEAIRQQMTQLEPAPDGAKAEKGLVLVVDFKGTVEGKPFKGSEAKDFLVELGAGNLLPALEEALAGMGKGEGKDIEIDYPADYFNKELAGKRGAFFVKLNDVKKKITPELNDDFAKDLGEFTTLKDVKADIEKRILQAKENEAKGALSVQVLEQLAGGHPFEIPEAMLNAELKSMFESFVRHLGTQNMKFEDTGMKIEDFIEKYKGDAQKRVRSFLVIDAIAEVEKISVSDEDVEERLKNIAQQAGQPLPKIKQQYESQNIMGGLRIQIQHEKTVNLIIDKAKIKVKKPEKAKKESK